MKLPKVGKPKKSQLSAPVKTTSRKMQFCRNKYSCASSTKSSTRRLVEQKIWANFNAQSFIHLKLSMQCSELFFMSVHVCNSSGEQLSIIVFNNSVSMVVFVH